MLRTPSTVRIRMASSSDAAELATVFRDSWCNAYQGILPEAHLSRIVRKRDTTWWQQTLSGQDPVLVLELADKLVGYATYGTSRARGRAAQGEIYELYLAPAYQGVGLGEHLFEACRNRLDERGLRGLIVWALVDNRAACHFYWRRGGRPRASVVEVFGNKRLEKAAFLWP
jgi:ribosomal protein S18 acetylase RimI-like enzyme